MAFIYLSLITTNFLINSLIADSSAPIATDCSRLVQTCKRHGACGKLWAHFRSQCPTRHQRCFMRSRQSCYEAFEYLRKTPLPRCKCHDDPEHRGADCHKLYIEINHNHCIETLFNLRHPLAVHTFPHDADNFKEPTLWGMTPLPTLSGEFGHNDNRPNNRVQPPLISKNSDNNNNNYNNNNAGLLQQVVYEKTEESSEEKSNYQKGSGRVVSNDKGRTSNSRGNLGFRVKATVTSYVSRQRHGSNEVNKGDRGYKPPKETSDEVHPVEYNAIFVEKGNERTGGNTPTPVVSQRVNTGPPEGAHNNRYVTPKPMVYTTASTTTTTATSTTARTTTTTTRKPYWPITPSPRITPRTPAFEKWEVMPTAARGHPNGADANAGNNVDNNHNGNYEDRIEQVAVAETGQGVSTNRSPEKIVDRDSGEKSVNPDQNAKSVDGGQIGHVVTQSKTFVTPRPTKASRSSVMTKTVETKVEKPAPPIHMRQSQSFSANDLKQACTAVVINDGVEERIKIPERPMKIVTNLTEKLACQCEKKKLVCVELEAHKGAYGNCTEIGLGTQEHGEKVMGDSFRGYCSCYDGSFVCEYAKGWDAYTDKALYLMFGYAGRPYSRVSRDLLKKKHRELPDFTETLMEDLNRLLFLKMSNRDCELQNITLASPVVFVLWARDKNDKWSFEKVPKECQHAAMEVVSDLNSGIHQDVFTLSLIKSVKIINLLQAGATPSRLSFVCALLCAVFVLRVNSRL